MKRKGVLFVCMGNICRSPAAEGVMRHLAADRGLDGELRIDSAGTTGYHVGEPPDRRMTQAAAGRGYGLDGSSRQLEAEDFSRFDLVVAMDRENLAGIRAFGGVAEQTDVRLLSDFLGDGFPVDVPDPYYGGRDGFETVLDMIEAACPQILETLLQDGPGA